LEYSKRQDALLDVGCSYGAFLDGAKDYFKNCEGIEINKKTARITRSKGFKVYNKPIEKLGITNAYDVIVVDQLLEHLYDLDSFMLSLKGALKKGGVLFISSPNLDSFGFKLFRKHHYQVCDMFHVNLFKIQTLKRLLEKHDFEINEIKTDNRLDIVPIDIFSYIFDKKNFIHLGNHNRLYPASYVAGRLIQRFIDFTNFLSLISKGAFLEVIARKK